MNISNDFKPVLTKAALALQQKQPGSNSSSNFQALVFQEPQAAAVADPGTKSKTTTQIVDADTNPEFDIKRARHEILNFARNNQRVIKNKRKMEIFQLVKLGMKPPKKVAKNYKELKEERQRLKNEREKRQKFHQLGKNQTGAASVKCRSQSKIQQQQKKRAPVSQIDQHYGKAQAKFKKRK